MVGMKTAAQKTMARIAKQIAKLQEDLSKVRYGTGDLSAGDAAAAHLWEKLFKAERAARNGANPSPEATSRSAQIATYIASH
jgi:glutathione S-transferase